MALSSMMHASRVCFVGKKTSSSASDSDLDLLVVLLRVVILVVVFVTIVVCTFFLSFSRSSTYAFTLPFSWCLRELEL